MTVLVQGTNSYFLGTQATLIEDDRDIASAWASKHIIKNDHIKWVVGKYVEADNANYNGQLWTLKDLQMKRPTILHAPMNVNHAAHKIVGTFPAAEMMYPLDDEAQVQNPYIEVLGAFWKFYFPDELSKVNRAFQEGELFLSMECVSKTVTCAGDDSCGQTFAYMGPRSETYCADLQNGGVRQLDDPNFLAGALIIPPVKPGWGGASVNEISTLIEENLAQAERVYAELSEQMPHLDSSKWEHMMVQLLQRAAQSEAQEMPMDSPSDAPAKCESCGASVQPDAKYCDQCGESLMASLAEIDRTPPDAIGRKVAREALTRSLLT